MLVSCLSLSLPRFIDVSSISHYPNRNGGNNNRTSILNRARIIPVSPSLIARSRFARPRSLFSAFPLSPISPLVDELSTIGDVFKLTCDQSPATHPPAGRAPFFSSSCRTMSAITLKANCPPFSLLFFYEFPNHEIVPLFLFSQCTFNFVQFF